MNTNLPDKTEISGAVIHKINYDEYLPKKGSLFDGLKYGLRRTSLRFKLTDPGYLHRLYLEKDKDYFQYLQDFRDKYSDCDVVVMNPGVDLVHPEFLFEHFKSSVKILHFIDDPHMTYSYGLPFSWVFDGATYISPSYSHCMDMETILKFAGFKWSKWLPHCVTNLEAPYWTNEELSNQFETRTNDSIYVGGYYKGKEARLLKLKKELGSQIDIFGRFPLRGVAYGAKLLTQRAPFYRVKSLTDEQRTLNYMNYKVGINMHLTCPSMETGNARLYEIPFHGMAQIADVSEHSLVESIFENEKEILLYRNVQECIEHTRMLLNDHELRNSIALNGYKKTISHYTMHTSMSNFISFLRNLL